MSVSDLVTSDVSTVMWCSRAYPFTRSSWIRVVKVNRAHADWAVSPSMACPHGAWLIADRNRNAEMS
jgi:hypothetical protein